MRTTISLSLSLTIGFTLLLLLSGVMSNDFDVFCELVSLSPNKTTWCSDCSNPCGNSCGVTCSNTRITQINATKKRLTNVSESIGDLTALNSLWSYLLKMIINWVYDRSLRSNKLSGLPDSIGNLTSLTYLYLWC